MNISDIHLLIEGIQRNTNFNRFNKNHLLFFVAIGTTIKAIKHAITRPIIIFNLQFLQYIILYN